MHDHTVIYADSGLPVDPGPESMPADVKRALCPAGGWRITASGHAERVW